MANKLITSSIILKESLRILVNEFGFTNKVDRQYKSEFAKTGAKIGDTVNLRMPNRYVTQKGPHLNLQETQEWSIPFTIDQWYQISMPFTDAELALSLDDFSGRYIRPAMIQLATDIDLDLLRMSLKVFNQVGTPGVTPGTVGGAGLLTTKAPDIFLNAKAMMDKYAVPPKDRSIILDPMAEAGTVAGLSGLFNNQTAVGEQYKTGQMGRAFSFDFFASQNVTLLTTGAHAGTPLVNGAGQTGLTLATKGWTASTTGVLKQGEIITLTGVEGINPPSRKTTGQAAYFVVTADVDADASGNAAVPIWPAIKPVSATEVDPTVTVSPANNAPVKLMSGDPNKSYPVSLAFHPEAFTFATVDLELPGGMDMAERENYEGISARLVRGFDIQESRMITRIDVLGGFKCIRPELALRITG